jgi:heat shock protein HslJ
MSRPLLLAMTSLLLAGCASDPVRLESDKTYQVQYLDGHAPIKHSHLTLVLGADGRAFGNAGCNHWFANYSRLDDRLVFAQPGSTRKLCAPELMEQEQRFLSLLEKVERWDTDDDEQLRLWPTASEPIGLIPERD